MVCSTTAVDDRFIQFRKLYNFKRIFLLYYLAKGLKFQCQLTLQEETCSRFMSYLLVNQCVKMVVETRGDPLGYFRGPPAVPYKSFVPYMGDDFAPVAEILIGQCVLQTSLGSAV